VRANDFANQRNSLEATSVIATYFQKAFPIKQLGFHDYFASKEPKRFSQHFPIENVNCCNSKIHKFLVFTKYHTAKKNCRKLNFGLLEDQYNVCCKTVKWFS